MGTIVERPIRDALRMIVPGPAVLISSMSRGQPNVMTAAWVSAQSLQPDPDLDRDTPGSPDARIRSP